MSKLTSDEAINEIAKLINGHQPEEPYKTNILIRIRYVLNDFFKEQPNE